MSFYLDTCVVIALLTAEDHSERAESWVEQHSGQDLAVSDWVTAEVSAGLAAKFRLGQIDEAVQDDARAAYGDLRRQSLSRLAVKTRHFTQAARLADVAAAGLRAGDALHLAVAVDHGAALVTLDKTFALACDRLNLPCRLI